MKLSKLRAKARSAFRRGPGRGRIRYRTDDGAVHDAEPAGVISVPVTVVRGRAFTRPQTALQFTALAEKKRLAWRRIRSAR